MTPEYWTGISQPANGTIRGAGEVGVVERSALEHGRVYR